MSKAKQNTLEPTIPSEPTPPKTHELTQTPPEIVNPFSPENLRLDASFNEIVGVRKVLAQVPVRRPSPQDWVRCHPSAAYRQNVAVINLKDDNEYFVVVQHLVPELFGECVSVTLRLTTTRQGVPFFWPIRTPDPTGRDMSWWQSARIAADLATQSWIRIKADRSLGGYQIFKAVDDLGDPEWPEQDFWQLVQIAFANNLIDKLDHPVIRRLRGFAS
jgi:hypothetical protein